MNFRPFVGNSQHSSDYSGLLNRLCLYAADFGEWKTVN